MLPFADIWDGNWTAHPYFAKRWQAQYGSDYIQTADELILTCKATNTEPLVQMSAAVALVEGVPAALDLSLRLLRKLTAAGLNVRHVAFGNENYGPWETPYGKRAAGGTRSKCERAAPRPRSRTTTAVQRVTERPLV